MNLIYRVAWISLLILFLIGIACIFWPQFQQYQEFKRREAELTQEIQAEEEMIKRLKHWQERFPADKKFVEQIAHEIGMAKTNEIIFTFIDDPAAAPPQ